MLLSRFLNTAAVLALLLAAPAMVLAQADAEVRALLVERDAGIKELLGPEGSDVPESRKAILRDEINGFLNFRAMGEAALGPHWSDLSAEQQGEFVTVFADIIRSQSLTNLDPFRARVNYDQITVTGNDARVVTSTVVDDVPMVIEYQLRRAGGTWQATDIIVDEVSTVEGYSRSFRTMIRKRGFETLMERLRARRDELTT
ncbi:MAG: ABC transporter substrate-binding protein [Rhodothermales bacterium]|nr:ABC transporter substrate-binding protein [Rhodothermales bacterium]MBO6778887.1 ABC transporter substrate-binding protein [Rhodothermales bacterium]